MELNQFFDTLSIRDKIIVSTSEKLQQDESIDINSTHNTSIDSNERFTENSDGGVVMAVHDVKRGETAVVAEPRRGSSQDRKNDEIHSTPKKMDAFRVNCTPKTESNERLADERVESTIDASSNVTDVAKNKQQSESDQQQQQQQRRGGRMGSRSSKNKTRSRSRDGDRSRSSSKSRSRSKSRARAAHGRRRVSSTDRLTADSRHDACDEADAECGRGRRESTTTGSSKNSSTRTRSKSMSRTSATRRKSKSLQLTSTSKPSQTTMGQQRRRVAGVVDTADPVSVDSNERQRSRTPTDDNEHTPNESDAGSGTKPQSTVKPPLGTSLKPRASGPGIYKSPPTLGLQLGSNVGAETNRSIRRKSFQHKEVMSASYHGGTGIQKPGRTRPALKMHKSSDALDLVEPVSRKISVLSQTSDESCFARHDRKIDSLVIDTMCIENVESGKASEYVDASVDKKDRKANAEDPSQSRRRPPQRTRSENTGKKPGRLSTNCKPAAKRRSSRDTCQIADACHDATIFSSEAIEDASEVKEDPKLMEEDNKNNKLQSEVEEIEWNPPNYDTDHHNLQCNDVVNVDDTAFGDAFGGAFCEKKDENPFQLVAGGFADTFEFNESGDGSVFNSDRKTVEGNEFKLSSVKKVVGNSFADAVVEKDNEFPPAKEQSSENCEAAMAPSDDWNIPTKRKTSIFSSISLLSTLTGQVATNRKTQISEDGDNDDGSEGEASMKDTLSALPSEDGKMLNGFFTRMSKSFTSMFDEGTVVSDILTVSKTSHSGSDSASDVASIFGHMNRSLTSVTTTDLMKTLAPYLSEEHEEDSETSLSSDMPVGMPQIKDRPDLEEAGASKKMPASLPEQMKSSDVWPTKFSFEHDSFEFNGEFPNQLGALSSLLESTLSKTPASTLAEPSICSPLPSNSKKRLTANPLSSAPSKEVPWGEMLPKEEMAGLSEPRVLGKNSKGVQKKHTSLKNEFGSTSDPLTKEKAEDFFPISHVKLHQGKSSSKKDHDNNNYLQLDLQSMNK